MAITVTISIGIVLVSSGIVGIVDIVGSAELSCSHHWLSEKKSDDDLFALTLKIWPVMTLDPRENPTPQQYPTIPDDSLELHAHI